MKTLYILIIGYVLYFFIQIVKDLFFTKGATSESSSKIFFEEHKPKKIYKQKNTDFNPQEDLEKSEAPDFNQEFFFNAISEENEVNKLVAEINEDYKPIEKARPNKKSKALKKEKEILEEKKSFLDKFKTQTTDDKSLIAEERLKQLELIIKNPDLISVELN